MTNTILSGHSIGISIVGGCTATVDGVLWHNTPLTLSCPISATVIISNQCNGDPVFVDPANRDYHLGSGSAAIDRGLTTDVTTDIDGDSRPYGLLPDLGADEWDEPWNVYLPAAFAYHSP
jgi:hypothetical protein